MSPPYIFVGGSGRSGTSALAALLGSLDEVDSLHDIELKLFNESGGILDLYDCFVRNFSFSRCKERLNEFELKYVNWIYDGVNFGQPSLNNFFSKEKIINEFVTLKKDLTKPYLRQLEIEYFRDKVQNFLHSVFYTSENKKYKLEKTPHVILDYERLNTLFPGSIFISVLRDPRAVAVSAMKFDWAGGINDLELNIDWVKGYFSSYLEKRELLLSKHNFLEIKIEDNEKNKIYLNNFFVEVNFEIEILKSEFIFDSPFDWSTNLNEEVKRVLNDRLFFECSALGYS